MGRKKGKQAGGFDSKSQHALFRRTVLVGHASEADGYRNPTADLGRGHGYRNDASLHNNRNAGASAGRWPSSGGGGSDKWSSAFRFFPDSIAATDSDSSNNANRASSMGLSRLRFLLEERRSEDRIHDRQLRLRFQRSRMMDAYETPPSSISGMHKSEDKHEPGWLLSHSTNDDSYSEESNATVNNTPQRTLSNASRTRLNDIPSLQIISAGVLGPLLPIYCAALGSNFVGECTRSFSREVLSKLMITLAMSDWSSEIDTHPHETTFATTDGAVKALAHSGVATGLVLRGTPLLSLNANMQIEEDSDDTRWLSDVGLLSLRPRIDGLTECNFNTSSGDGSSCDHWETLDFDSGLSCRMAGLFHLKRLELIDVPLNCAFGGSGGISLSTLRSVLRSCSSITHLSLSGCFYNWGDASLCILGEPEDDISVLMSGNISTSFLTDSIKNLGKLRGGDEGAMHLLPQLLVHQMFQENEHDIPGLDELLPELQVLDVSRCSWVTIPMVVQLLLKLRGRDGTFACVTQATNNVQIRHQLDNGEACDKTSSIVNNGDDMPVNSARHPPTGIHSGIDTSSKKKCKFKISTSLRHLNIMGCTGLQSTSSSLPSWVEEWRGHGIFDGVNVSNDRETRR